jgi:hypothetical protein
VDGCVGGGGGAIRQCPLQGPLFKSVTRIDFELCGPCSQRPGAAADGPFVRIDVPLPMPPSPALQRMRQQQQQQQQHATATNTVPAPPPDFPPPPGFDFPPPPATTVAAGTPAVLAAGPDAHAAVTIAAPGHTIDAVLADDATGSAGAAPGVRVVAPAPPPPPPPAEQTAATDGAWAAAGAARSNVAGLLQRLERVLQVCAYTLTHTRMWTHRRGRVTGGSRVLQETHPGVCV